MSLDNINFTKMVATGNDFVVIDLRPSTLPRTQAKRVVRDFVFHPSLHQAAQIICQRKTGIGADGLLLLEKSNKADFKMRIFNSDGSEAEMCGNGLRCAVMHSKVDNNNITIETKAGIYYAAITGKDTVKIKMMDPADLKQGISVKMSERHAKVTFINTGVPHAVILVQGIEDIDIKNIGNSIRYNKVFMPAGANVDFVEITDDNNIKMRTYERGVEDETLACGTGAVASAIVSGLNSHTASGIQHIVNVHTKGGLLKVYFKMVDLKVNDVYLEGEAKIVFTGVYKNKEK